MSEKPEALRLAGELESMWKKDPVAAELRRQHAENERLHDELRQSSIDITRAEVERLKAENERLRDGLACDWAELKACRASLREHLLEIERLREALTYDWDQLEACRESLREHMVEIKRLREEVRVLRLYGNKDCTAMADEAMKEAALRREET